MAHKIPPNSSDSTNSINDVSASISTSTSTTTTATATTTPTIEPNTDIVDTPFPASYFDSFKKWWRRTDPAGAEDSLVKLGLGNANIPLLGPEDPGDGARYKKVQLSGKKDRYMHMLEIGPYKRQENEMPIVVLSGYGGGLAFYFQNFKALSGLAGTRTYLTDWLGMGRSGRPHFPDIKVKGDPKTQENVISRVTQAESFFVDSLEEWRKRIGLNKMTLVGHSLGGYMSTAYAIKYPERVHKLVLLSPVGIPESPYSQVEQPMSSSTSFSENTTSTTDTTTTSSSLDSQSQTQTQTQTQFRSHSHSPPTSSASSLKSNNYTSVESEITQDQVETTGGTGSGPTNEDTSANQSVPTPNLLRPRRTWWHYLWDQNISPFTFIRVSTIFGPLLVSKYAQRRFATFDYDVAKALYEYTYAIWTLRGSGEYVLAHVLAPGAYARYPMIRRINQVRVPVSFCYGEMDWMDVKGGIEALKIIKSKPRTPENVRQLDQSKVYVNPYSGHWVFLDNPQGFNDIIKDELQEAKNSWGPNDGQQLSPQAST